MTVVEVDGILIQPTFWIHSRETGMYNTSPNKIPNSNNPVFRDTVILYPTSQTYTDPHTQLQNYQKLCRGTKIRFIADNPGLWLLHCHIGAHAFIGMTVLFNEDTEHLFMNYMLQNEIKMFFSSNIIEQKFKLKLMQG